MFGNVLVGDVVELLEVVFVGIFWVDFDFIIFNDFYGIFGYVFYFYLLLRCYVRFDNIFIVFVNGDNYGVGFFFDE